MQLDYLMQKMSQLANQALETSLIMVDARG
jgi:hypothetical protein